MFQNKDSEPRETHQWSQFEIPASPFSGSQDFQKDLTSDYQVIEIRIRSSFLVG